MRHDNDCCHCHCCQCGRRWLRTSYPLQWHCLYCSNAVDDVGVGYYYKVDDVFHSCEVVVLAVDSHDVVEDDVEDVVEDDGHDEDVEDDDHTVVVAVQGGHCNAVDVVVVDVYYSMNWNWNWMQTLLEHWSPRVSHSDCPALAPSDSSPFSAAAVVVCSWTTTRCYYCCHAVADGLPLPSSA